MDWKELCEVFDGTYFVSKTTGGKTEEVCSVIDEDAFIALLRVLKQLYKSGAYKKLSDKLVAKYDFGGDGLEYNARAELDNQRFDVNLQVERFVASAELVGEVAEENGLSENEVEEAIDKFFEEGSELRDKIKALWVREKTNCETYFDGDNYIAKCEADIPGDLVNSSNLDKVFNELRGAVEEAELPLL